MNESSWTVILARNKKMINEEQTIDYREGNEMIQKLYVEKSSLRKRKEKKRKENVNWLKTQNIICFHVLETKYRLPFRLLNSTIPSIEFEGTSDQSWSKFSEARTILLYFRTRKGFGGVFASGVVVPGPRSRSCRIVLQYTTHRTLQSLVSS